MAWRYNGGDSNNGNNGHAWSDEDGGCEKDGTMSVMKIVLFVIVWRS